MNKKTLAVVFGGQSSEHEVSCMSAANIADQINQDKYEILLIGITKDGHWLKTESVAAIRDSSWQQSSIQAIISPDATEQCVLLSDEAGTTKLHIDVVFPVLHGLYGEDGTIQGLLELTRIPYVGCGVLSSAVSMDKLYTKIIVKELGFRQADYVPVLARELHADMQAVVARIEARFDYPVFIKPSNAGSSKGVSKAENREMLEFGLVAAARHDRKILVEETICGREIECAVLGGGHQQIRTTGVGEILAAAEFYDYDAKYHNNESQTVVNPTLPGDSTEQIRRTAAAIFSAVDGYGLARVDFFVTAEGDVIFNEINTMPGFTAISMYPMLWEAAGIDKPELVDTLITMAFERDNEEIY